MRKKRKSERDPNISSVLVLQYLGCPQITVQDCYGDLIVICPYFIDIYCEKSTVLRLLILHKTRLPLYPGNYCLQSCSWSKKADEIKLY